MLDQLKPPAGATKNIKRVGRGSSSGQGCTAGRGNKGQKSRSGCQIRPGFEGGQMPLQRRMPKRGFFNLFRVEYAVVNVRDLERFDADSVVDPQALRRAGLIRSRFERVKVLGLGECSKKLKVQAQGFSRAAREKIEKVGGQAEVIAQIRKKVKQPQEA